MEATQDSQEVPHVQCTCGFLTSPDFLQVVHICAINRDPDELQTVDDLQNGESH